MVSLILLAAWSSIRFWNKNKLKSLLWWVPIFLHSLAKFYKHPEISEIIIVSSEEEIEDYRLLQKTFPKVKKVVIWWKLRQDSVINWLKEISGEILLIHNWCNPWVTDEEIDEVIRETKEHWACAPWSKVVNTIKQVSENWFIVKTIERKDLYEVQTPQWVNTKKFKQLINSKSETQDSKLITDDVSYFEQAWLPVKITQSSPSNFKITTQEDLKKAQVFVKQDLVIWIWHDSHKLILWKKPLMLWWIWIESEFSFEANSDWDVLIHALCNAIWTAIWEWSLSLYSDKMLKDWKSDSMEYLKHIFSEIEKRGFVVWNISATIEWKQPKLEKYIGEIKENLAKLMKCNTYQIWIAITSWEDLTSFWKWEWMQCFVNVILKAITS